MQFDNVIEARGLSMQFGNVAATDARSFSGHPGKIDAFVAPSGPGASAPAAH